MVNNGPSRGCQICRRRKIKCDETLPECRRCLLRGYKCPGVRENRDVTFRHRVVRPKDSNDDSSFPPPDSTHQTQSFADSTALVLSSSGKSSESSSHYGSRNVSGGWTPETSPSSSPHLTTRRLSTKSSVSIIRGPATSWTDAARSQYIPFLIQDTRSMAIINPWTSLIAQSAGRVHRADYLDNALTACSLQRLADNPPFQVFKQDAAAKYGRALALLNVALRAGRIASDECLVSVMLITIYGWAQGDDGVLTNYNHHLDGLMRMLDLRGVEQTKDPVSCRVFCAIRERISMNHGILCKPFPFARDDPDHAWFFEAPNRSASPWDELQKIALEVPYIRQRMLQLTQRTDDGVLDAAEELVLDARVVHAAFLSWYRNLPEDWQRPKVVAMPKTTNLPPLGSVDHTYENVGYVYPNPSIAMVVSWFNAFDILTLQVILTCVSIRDSTHADSPTVQRPGPNSPFPASLNPPSPDPSAGTSAAATDPSSSPSAINTLLRTAVDQVCSTVHVYTVRDYQVFELGRAIQPFDLIFACYMIEPMLLCLSVSCISLAQKQWLHAKMCDLSGEHWRTYHSSALAVMGGHSGHFLTPIERAAEREREREREMEMEGEMEDEMEGEMGRGRGVAMEVD